jgi:hypothetical protein
LLSQTNARYVYNIIIIIIIIIIVVVVVVVESADLSGRTVSSVDLGRLDTAIAGSNPAQGTDVCPRISVLCRPV